MSGCRLDVGFGVEEDVFFGGAVDFIFQSQDQEAGAEHEGGHEVVTHVEAACLSLDPGHHIRTEHAAQVAAGVDEAMEPAAAGPERNVVGMVHHTPMEAWMPIADRQMRNKATPML